MKFDTAIDAERKQAMSYFMGLINRRKLVEVKKVSPNRSLRQNSYLHLLIGFFGLHFGWDMDEAKTIYKRWNQDIYYYEKNGQKFLRPSSDLTVDEMTASIETFRRRAAEQGLDLPAPTDTDFLRHIDNVIQQSKKH